MSGGPLHNKTTKRLAKQVAAMQRKYLREQALEYRTQARRFCGPLLVGYVNGHRVFGITQHALNVAKEWEAIAQLERNG